MKTILTMALLASALSSGACSRSDKQTTTAAPATPEPTIAAQATSAPKSEAELATSAETDKPRAVPSISRESQPAVAPVSSSAAENDPASGPVSGLAPASNLENEKDPGTGRVSGIEVDVVSSTGKTIVAQAKTNIKGMISVQLPRRGNYVVRYSSGPAKGKVIQTINATEAGRVNISVPPPSAAP
jgi:hypothetical protein